MSAPDPNIRLSNAEREAVIARLHAATEEGRLDLDEFAERSQQVYEAKTYADVERLLTDLPENDRALAVPSRSKTVADAPDLVLDSSYSHVRREGAWTVPARITVAPRYGSVRLDCRHADFAAGDIEIALDLKYASCEIVLPANASAVDDVRLHGGHVDNRGRREADGPRFHLFGGALYGNITVRYERRFLWWRW